MQRANKYEIWLVNLQPSKGHEQRGIRPCLIYQSSIISEYNLSNTHIIIPITSQLKGSTYFTVKLDNYKNYGLSMKSELLSFQLRVVDNSGLIRKIGKISDLGTISKIKDSVKMSLDFDDNFND